MGWGWFVRERRERRRWGRCLVLKRVWVLGSQKEVLEEGGEREAMKSWWRVGRMERVGELNEMWRGGGGLLFVEESCGAA